ncbi:MAG TPA: hypothetical protein V6D22_04410 [Candidatus Obscuribacterales bacterium]
MRKNNLAVAAMILALGTPAAVFAQDDTPDWIKDTSGVGHSKNGTVRSDQILELGNTNPSALQLEGENSLRMGNLDTALTALQKSVEMAPLDMDKRTLYAEALQEKLQKQKEKDPTLYNFTVKQWYFIYKKAEFIDQTLEAKSHLLHLTGSAPKNFESAQKYLARVLVPEDSSEIASAKKQAAE